MKPLGALLAGFLCRALPEEERETFDAVAAVPLHWRRRWQRGFNQSGLLAARVARQFRLPSIQPLRRVRATATQAGLTNSNRRKNVAGAFRVARRGKIEGKRILLIDDVMTTGATGAACATALKRAGAKSVTLLTLARVDRRFVNSTSGK
jgi:ComF family protein